MARSSPDGSAIGSSPQSRIQFPLSVISGDSPRVRMTGRRPSRARRSRQSAAPKGRTSTGSRPRLPSTGTSFSRPTRTTNRRAAVATIFSRRSAPPYPLIKSPRGSTSSAPSTARSRMGWSASVTRRIPSCCASWAVASEVETPATWSPACTRVARARTNAVAARPVPSPRTCPFSTSWSSASRPAPSSFALIDPRRHRPARALPGPRAPRAPA